MLCSGRARLLAALLLANIFHAPAVEAQNETLIWTFSQTGAGAAQLLHHVPETDNVQVSATCGRDSPDNATSFIASVDTGNLRNGEQTRLRFSGGGKEYELAGRALVPTSGEALHGVEVLIPHSHAVWHAFQSNDLMTYQVPGYHSQNLPLAGGQDTIANFVNTCRNMAAGAGSTGIASTGTDDAKDAFVAARKLNTAEGYRAFINAYPSGFYADLARAHLNKLNGGATATRPSKTTQATQPPLRQPNTSPALATYTVGPGVSSWYNATYSSDTGNQYVAAVQAGGLELLAVCTPDRAIRLAVREAQPGQYPQFSERIRQGSQRNPTADLNYPGKGSYRAMFQTNDGRGLAMSHAVATSNGIVRSLLSGQTLLLSQPPFAAIFQLNGSRTAVCNVLNACGANTPECSSRPPSPAVRSSSGGSGCRSGQIRVEGRCMTRAEAVGFCGPGYRVSGNKCVHQNNISRNVAPKKKAPRARMLKRNEGGTISEAACLRKGMVPEFGYCVEND